MIINAKSQDTYMSITAVFHCFISLFNKREQK